MLIFSTSLCEADRAIRAILASFLLDEKLGRLGICGCALCIVRGSPPTLYNRVGTLTFPQIGSVVIVLHAPSDKEVETVDEILGYAAKFRTCGFSSAT